MNQENFSEIADLWKKAEADLKELISETENEIKSLKNGPKKKDGREVLMSLEYIRNYFSEYKEATQNPVLMKVAISSGRPIMMGKVPKAAPYGGGDDDIEDRLRKLEEEVEGLRKKKDKSKFFDYAFRGVGIGERLVEIANKIKDFLS